LESNSKIALPRPDLTPANFDGRLYPPAITASRTRQPGTERQPTNSGNEQRQRTAATNSGKTTSQETKSGAVDGLRFTRHHHKR